MKAALEFGVKNETNQFSDEANKIADRAALSKVSNGNWKVNPAFYDAPKNISNTDNYVCINVGPEPVKQ